MELLELLSVQPRSSHAVTGSLNSLNYRSAHAQNDAKQPTKNIPCGIPVLLSAYKRLKPKY